MSTIREKFEAWAESEGRTISQWPSGEYEDSLLNSQWDAVQAVAATEAAKGKGRYCAHCQREADNECKNCKGYGVVTHISGMTPDNYEECNEVCPDCKGEGTEAAKATGTAGEPTRDLTRAQKENSDFHAWWESSGQKAAHDLRTENAAHATWQERARRDYTKEVTVLERHGLVDYPNSATRMEPHESGAWVRFSDACAFGQACAEAARHDKDGNHADDLRAWLDEARDEIEVQGAALHATSLDLKAAEAELAARQPAPVVIKERENE